jgi:PilZ domain
MPELVERRQSLREKAIENEATLNIGMDGGRRRVSARIIDISPKGALIRVIQKLPLDMPLWLRVEKPVKTDWIEAIPVRLGEQHTVGIVFRECCRDDFLWATVLGLDFRWVVTAQTGSSSGDEDGVRW